MGKLCIRQSHGGSREMFAPNISNHPVVVDVSV